MKQEKSEQELYDEIAYYTLAHPGAAFIHQHVVDAFTVQHADESTKPIAVAFALIGLCLQLEKNYSGKEVQRAHMQLAKRRTQWPVFNLPKDRGDITVCEVVSVRLGLERDEAINKMRFSGPRVVRSSGEYNVVCIWKDPYLPDRMLGGEIRRLENWIMEIIISESLKIEYCERDSPGF